MKNILLTLSLASFAISSCNTPVENLATKDNPLLNTYDNRYNIVPFEKVEATHFSPAVIVSMDIAKKELDQIINNKEAPSFDNTIVALDMTGKQLKDIVSVFNYYLAANTSDKLQEVAEELLPIISKFFDDIYINEPLFERVKSVYNHKETLDLDPEQKALLDKTYKEFLRNGAGLTPKDKQKLSKINVELTIKKLRYSNNLISEINNYKLEVDKPEHLAGLPQELMDASKVDDKWVFTLQNSSLFPFLQYADNRILRRQIWEAYQSLCNNNTNHDNKVLVLQISNLRLAKAQLLGYESYADYQLETTMAKSPEAVNDLLQELWKPAIQQAKIEATAIKQYMLRDSIDEAVQPYDWRYYAEQIRKEQYNLDEQDIKPYFELNRVRDGVFMVAQKLYGLIFQEVYDLPKYHQDITTWEVLDADSQLLGILYMDLYPRVNKMGGSWMTSLRAEHYNKEGKRNIPVTAILCNFPLPNKKGPSLLSFDEAVSLFHEFGHALHGLLSDCKYITLSGTSVARDFVELPAQIMENWATDPAVIKMFAIHYQTHQPIPDSLVKKLSQANTYNQGFATTEYLAAAILDMNYHSITEVIKQDINEFEKNATEAMGLIDAIIPRYRSTYFRHIFSEGYQAGYYSYIWSGVLDSDAFEAFKQSGNLFNPVLAKRFRKNILEKGGSEEPASMYQAFRGKNATTRALLQKKGFKTVH